MPVHGIDLSADMVAQLRAKPGGAGIPSRSATSPTTRAAATFSLVYVVFNTILNLTTQDAQVACFRERGRAPRAGRLLRDRGRRPARRRRRLSVFDLSDSHVGVDEYDAATQRLVSHHFTLVEGRWERLSMPVPLRPAR